MYTLNLKTLNFKKRINNNNIYRLDTKLLHLHEKKYILFGGSNKEDVDSNEIYIYDYKLKEWVLITVNMISNYKLLTSTHLQIIYNNYLYILGGYNYKEKDTNKIIAKINTNDILNHFNKVINFNRIFYDKKYFDFKLKLNEKIYFLNKIILIRNENFFNYINKIVDTNNKINKNENIVELETKLITNKNFEIILNYFYGNDIEGYDLNYDLLYFLLKFEFYDIFILILKNITTKNYFNNFQIFNTAIKELKIGEKEEIIKIKKYFYQIFNNDTNIKKLIYQKDFLTLDIENKIELLSSISDKDYEIATKYQNSNSNLLLLKSMNSIFFDYRLKFNDIDIVLIDGSIHKENRLILYLNDISEKYLNQRKLDLPLNSNEFEKLIFFFYKKKILNLFSHSDEFKNLFKFSIQYKLKRLELYLNKYNEKFNHLFYFYNTDIVEIIKNKATLKFTTNKICTMISNFIMNDGIHLFKINIENIQLKKSHIMIGNVSNK
jgi:hypothetical protein